MHLFVRRRLCWQVTLLWQGGLGRDGKARFRETYMEECSLRLSLL